jgi:hypothetical protein
MNVTFFRRLCATAQIGANKPLGHVDYTLAMAAAVEKASGDILDWLVIKEYPEVASAIAQEFGYFDPTKDKSHE